MQKSSKGNKVLLKTSLKLKEGSA